VDLDQLDVILLDRVLCVKFLMKNTSSFELLCVNKNFRLPESIHKFACSDLITSYL
jgi:hypothetical protein